MDKVLKIENLHVKIGEKPILKGIDLTVRQGETHALLGPNGSGKSTLAYALMGHPNYEITEGTVLLDGRNLIELEPDQRAKVGLFLAFQYPTSIPGVTVASFLRQAVSNVRNPQRKEGEELVPMREFRKELQGRMSELGVNQEFARRYLNEGFSGGEKKRAEILQMAMLRPSFAVLDETDSGLDVEAMRIVSEGVTRVAGEVRTGVIVVTHYLPGKGGLLDYMRTQFMHVMLGGKIVESRTGTGVEELVRELGERGFQRFREQYPDLVPPDESEETSKLAG